MHFLERLRYLLRESLTSFSPRAAGKQASPLPILVGLFLMAAAPGAARGGTILPPALVPTQNPLKSLTRKVVSAADDPLRLDRFEAPREEASLAENNTASTHTASGREVEEDTEDLCVSPFDSLESPGDSGSAPSPNSGAAPAAAAPFIPAKTNPAEHVHWKPLLLQSLNFMLVEQGFRYVQQSDLRYQLWHKPFWYDYGVSLAHWDVSHWGDGDNFYTNYLGHPMQGAISGYIWIQNDPAALRARYGSEAYWHSRLKALAWSTVYSMQFEEGPILSETAMGSQGGYYFVPGCGYAPCSKPGQHFKPATVGTGWVDLVVTPAGGFAWMLLEDWFMAKVMPRWGGDDPALGWRFLGAVLTPNMSMATFMAGRLPWARHTEGNGILSQPAGARHSERDGFDALRYEAGIHYVNLNLPMDWQGCTACRVMNSGVGGVFAYRLSHSFWLDTETNFFPGSGESGSAVEGLYGVRYGIYHGRWAAYAKVRPGFIHYEQASSYPSAGELRPLTRFAFDTGTVVEYRASPRGMLRLDMGSTFVRYLQGPDPSQPPIGWVSPDYYATQGNFQLALGYVHRF